MMQISFRRECSGETVLARLFWRDCSGETVLAIRI